MKKSNLLKMSILFCCFIWGLAAPKYAAASGVEISLASDSTSITEGEEFHVSITVKSDTPFGDIEANIIYNEEVIEYISGPSVINGGSGFLRVSDRNSSTGEQNRKYVLKFQSLSVGSADIAIDGRAMVYNFDTGLEMPVSSNILNLNIVAPASASDKANLKSLKVSPSELTPAFAPNVYEYNLNVENEVEKLVVSATPEDEKASVEIKGNNFLQEGENKVIITVIAESGNIIEYTINAYRELSSSEEEDEETIPNSEDKSYFEVIKENGNIFAMFQGRYQLIEPGAEVQIPNGYMKTRAILSEISVTAYTLENDLNNDFLLLYAKNENGEAGFYRYDRVEKTLQRFVQGSSIGGAKQVTTDMDKLIESDEYRSKLNIAMIAIGVLCGFCILLIFLLIQSFKKTKRRRRRRR